MNRKGIWLDKNTFHDFAERPAGALSSEIASRDRSIDFYSLGMYLPNPDPVLKKMGKDISVYSELLSDGFLGGCASSRKAAVKSLEWEIGRGKSKTRQAKQIQSIFKDLDIDRIISEMLNAPLFGYQPMEVMLKNGGSFLYPEDITGKPQRWFVFDEKNEPRFLTKTNPNPGEPLPPGRFLFARHEPTYENPYGFAGLSRCFWPVTFKKGGYKFWVRFVEKYGMPWPVGKLPRGLDQKEYQDLADMLDRMVQDGLAVIPDDSSVELNVAEGKGATGSIYKDLIESCKTEISIALLGQNLTTEVKGGSFAATQGHMTVRQDIRDGDKKIPQKEFNRLIKWIYEWNYSERIAEHPEFIFYEQEDVDKDQAERDKTLSETGQLRFTKKYFVKTYGFEDDDIEAPEGQRSGSVNAPYDFSAAQHPTTPQDISPVEAMARRLSAEGSLDDLLTPVEKLLNEAASLEEFRDRLIDLYPYMDALTLGITIERALAAADLAGRFDAGRAT